METSLPFTPMVVQIAAALLCGGIVNWLADRLPQGRGSAITPTGRGRWWMVMLACVGIFLYVGRVGGLVLDDLWPDGGWLLYLYLLLFLLIAAIDLEHRRVLNIVIGPAALMALMLAALQSPQALGSALLGGLGGFLLFFAVNLMRPGAMGAGDVKLAGLIGIIAGVPNVIVALAIGIIAGGVSALILMASGRVSRTGTLAYAPYLSLGASIALVHGPQILAWYGQRLSW
jgi:prepilin signal peptidase PulO-like enzyme (type II secretory pathway)